MPFLTLLLFEYDITCFVFATDSSSSIECATLWALAHTSQCRLSQVFKQGFKLVRSSHPGKSFITGQNKRTFYNCYLQTQQQICLKANPCASLIKRLGKVYFWIILKIQAKSYFSILHNTSCLLVWTLWFSPTPWKKGQDLGLIGR